MKRMLCLAIATFLLAACSPEVGSPRWCEKMKAKPKGEWTVDEIGEYGKSCLLR